MKTIVNLILLLVVTSCVQPVEEIEEYAPTNSRYSANGKGKPTYSPQEEFCRSFNTLENNCFSIINYLSPHVYQLEYCRSFSDEMQRYICATKVKYEDQHTGHELDFCRKFENYNLRQLCTDKVHYKNFEKPFLYQCQRIGDEKKRILCLDGKDFEEAPPVEEQPPVIEEQPPVTEEFPIVEDNPIKEETPIVEESPVKEEPPVIEEPTVCYSPDELLQFSNSELYKMGINKDKCLGKCYISDHQSNPNTYCDLYVKTGIVGELGLYGWPKNPSSGDSTGCLKAPYLAKRMNTCWPGNTSYMCSLDHVHNGGETLRDALKNNACGLGYPTRYQPKPEPVEEIVIEEVIEPEETPTDLLSLSDSKLFEMGLTKDPALGSCRISDHRKVSHTYCDFYVHSAVKGSYGYTGWPKNPSSGDSTGCLKSPLTGKAMSICWPGNTTSMCTNDHIHNGAEVIRDAIRKKACGISN